MLVLAFMLLSGPVGQVPEQPVWTQRSSVGGRIIDSQIVQADGSALRFQSGRCAALLHRVAPSGNPTVVTRSGTFSLTPTVGEDRVKMYHLLERTIDGCRVPVIAIDHLPEADQAIGRNLGRFVTPR